MLANAVEVVVVVDGPVEATDASKPSAVVFIVVCRSASMSKILFNGALLVLKIFSIFQSLNKKMTSLCMTKQYSKSCKDCSMSKVLQTWWNTKKRWSKLMESFDEIKRNLMRFMQLMNQCLFQRIK